MDKPLRVLRRRVDADEIRDQLPRTREGFPEGAERGLLRPFRRELDLEEAEARIVEEGSGRRHLSSRLVRRSSMKAARSSGCMRTLEPMRTT